MNNTEHSKDPILRGIIYAFIVVLITGIIPDNLPVSSEKKELIKAIFRICLLLFGTVFFIKDYQKRKFDVTKDLSGWLLIIIGISYTIYNFPKF